MNIRQLADALGGGRARLSNIASRMFGGRRDLYRAFGYKRVLTVEDYRARYQRNAVANRIVKALPKGTWRGGAEIIEDEEPTKTTAFEDAFEKLAEQVELWDKLYRADVLAGIGRYSILWIGAPGEVDTPLERAGLDEISYLTPYAEDDATIEAYEADPTNKRFGQPTFYSVKRTTIVGNKVQTGMAKRVHWTRVIHIADGLLDDNIYGEPRLECVWNLIDDLEKVHGGGAEAFYRRADGGMQFDLDPTLDFNQDSKDALKRQLHEYEHDYKRMLLTRGVKVNNLGSNVADFGRPVDAIISLVSAGTGIPQRILMGSERGQLASNQDASNWDDRCQDRRNEWAKPIVKRVINRFQELGVLPEPQKPYQVQFSELRIMDDQQRAEIASKWASLNSAAGEIVVTVDDIRERVLELPPLEEVLSDSAGGGGEAAEGEGEDAKPKSKKKAPTVEERAMLQALERAIRTNNTTMLEVLLGLDPVVRTIESGATASAAPSAELVALQAKVADLQGMVAQEDSPLRELAASLIETVRTMVATPPVVNVQMPKRRFKLNVNRDSKGLLAAGTTLEEMS